MLIFALILLCLIFFLPLIFHFKYKEIRWDWDGIDISEISFPKSFIWGTATASHQVEGNCNNNWSKFEESSQNFVDETTRLFEVAKDGAIKKNALQIRKTGKTCSGCHRNFRKRN